MDGYTIFLVVCNFVIPLVLLAGGAFMLGGGKKKINDICGYRSALSMRTMETWRFAHRYAGRLWLIFGGVALGITTGIVIGALCAGGGQLPLWTFFCMAIQVAAAVLPLAPTEKALRTQFDKYGCPITPYAVRMSGEHWGKAAPTPAQSAANDAADVPQTTAQPAPEETNLSDYGSDE